MTTGAWGSMPRICVRTVSPASGQEKDQEGWVWIMCTLEPELIRASAIAARVSRTQGTPTGTMVREVSDTFLCICEPLTYRLVTLPELLGSTPQLDPLLF